MPAAKHGKFDQEVAHKALEWIKTVIAEDFDTDGSENNFQDQLETGVKLCKFINGIAPGSVKKIEASTGLKHENFKCMANIESFVNAAMKFGVPKEQTFQAIDLFNRKDLFSVVTCLVAVDRVCEEKGMDHPDLGR